MPEQTPLRKFIKSLDTKVTDTTKALDGGWQSLGAAGRAAMLTSLAGGSLTPLPEDLETLLRNHGLGDKEIAHINAWPDAPKQQVLSWLAPVASNDNVVFRWELHGGGNEDVAVQPAAPSAAAKVTVTFRSPQAKVHLWAAPTFGEINVSV